MALKEVIDDGISKLEFFDTPHDQSGTLISSFVKWTYNPIPTLIRVTDFVPEPLSDPTGQGLIAQKMPPRDDPSKLIGCTPQNDCGQPNAAPSQFTKTGLSVQFEYTTVNEFYTCLLCNNPTPNPYSSTGIHLNLTYTLDGQGNIIVEYVVVSPVAPVSPVVQNLHLLMLQKYNHPTYGGGLLGWNYETERNVAGPAVVTEDTSMFFPNLPGGIDTYLLHDVLPKQDYPINTPFTDMRCKGTLYFQDPRATSEGGVPRVIGYSRKENGYGVLSVHGRLPSSSQPLQLGLYVASDGGIAPMLSQLAMLGYAQGTITRFRLFFLPMNGVNNNEQKARALNLADYSNPISVTPI